MKTVARVYIGKGEANKGKLMATSSFREGDESKPVVIANTKVGETDKNKAVATGSVGKGVNEKQDHCPIKDERRAVVKPIQ